MTLNRTVHESTTTNTYIMFYFARYLPKQANWAETITKYTHFSSETTATLESGVPTQRARDEFVNALSTPILVHTLRPNSDDYNTVCKRLMTKHPTINMMGMYAASINIYTYITWTHFSLQDS